MLQCSGLLGLCLFGVSGVFFVCLFSFEDTAVFVHCILAFSSYYSSQPFSRVWELVLGNSGSERWQRQGYPVSSNTQPGGI